MIYATKKLLALCAIALQISSLYPAAAGVNPSEPTKYEMDQLMHFIYLGNLIDVKNVLDTCPSIINEKDEYGFTALHNAAKLDKGSIVELLLAARAECDIVDNNGSTPLWLATYMGNFCVLKRLVKAGANPHMLRCHWGKFIAAADIDTYDNRTRMVINDAIQKRNKVRRELSVSALHQNGLWPKAVVELMASYDAEPVYPKKQ